MPDAPNSTSLSRPRSFGTGRRLGRESAAGSDSVAEVSRHDRLQPYLLDRLTFRSTEEREAGLGQSSDLQELRRRVLRDLSWLLNTRLREVWVPGRGKELSDIAKTSVLNFGVADISAFSADEKSARSVGVEVKKLIEHAINTYEPRIRKCRVRLSSDEPAAAGRFRPVLGRIKMTIEGELFCRPMNQPLLVRTEIDLASGQCEIADA